MTEKLRVHKKNFVKTLIINKPEVRNAIDPDVMAALRGEIEAAHDDPETRVIVIRGEGGHFCSGADIKHAMTNLNGGSLADAGDKTLRGVYAPAQLAIRNAPMPVIAAVEGYAAGFGCDLALRCDLRLVSENARFSELFIRVGLIPDGGGTYMLPRHIGLARAMEMMFTGDDVGAEEALRIGLVNKVFPEDTFHEQVVAYAERLAENAPLALERGKRAMLQALEGGTYADALAQEATFQHEIFSSEDGTEGFMAFMEKRKPNWKGR